MRIGKHRFDKKNKKKRGLALILSVLLGVMAYSAGSTYDVYADDPDEETSSEGSTEGTPDDSANIMQSENGRIVFWEWQKVTSQNVSDLLNDGKYHASMFVMLDKNKNPTGFISTYADKDHITRGIQVDRFGDDFDSIELDTGYYAIYSSIQTGMNKSIEYWYGTDDDHIHYTTSSFISHFNLQTTMFVKQDQDGYSLNDHMEYFTKNKFYTSGGSMGVLWAKFLGNQQATDAYNTQRNVPVVAVDLALSRASAKNNPADQSYNSIGMNLNGNKDYFIRMAKTDLLQMSITDFNARATLGLSDQPAKAKDSWKYEGVKTYSDYTHFSRQKGWDSGYGSGYIDGKSSNEEKCWTGVFYNNPDAKTGKYEYHFPVDVSLLVPYKGSKNDDRWVIEDYNMSSFLVYKDGYFLPVLKTYYMYADREKAEPNQAGYANYGCFHGVDDAEQSIATFYWYVGTPHMFASLTDPGQTITIPSGETFIVKDSTFTDADGNLVKSEGVVLPEGARIEIEDGGVLSVEGNFINNGRVINRGGTIVVKDGASIYPYTSTKEGSIECGRSPTTGRTGDMIIMEGAKVFCLVDANSYDAKTVEPALKLVAGGSVINYGTLVTSFAVIDTGSRIENRKDSLFFPGHNRTNDTADLSRSTVRKGYVANIEKIPSDKVMNTRSGDLYSLTNYYHTGVHGLIAFHKSGNASMSMTTVSHDPGVVLSAPTASVDDAGTYVFVIQKTMEY